jgi:hypothetical protein
MLLETIIGKWGNVWDRTCNKKEGAFIWSIWNKVVAVKALSKTLMTNVSYAWQAFRKPLCIGFGAARSLKHHRTSPLGSSTL